MRFLSTLVASTLGTLVALGILLFFLMIFFVGLASTTDPAPRIRPGSVLTLELSGTIPEVVPDDPFARAFGDLPAADLLDYRSALKKAAADERITALWLKVRGVSASWATLEEVRSALLDFKATGKPVIASSNDYMVNEKAYFLASVADSIYASPEAMIEFNGFFLMAEFYKPLLDKLAVEPQVIRAGAFKSAVEPYLREDLSPENEVQLTAMLETINTAFIGAVAQSRELQVARVEGLLAQEVPFRMPEAQQAGLIDGLLFEDEVVDRVKALVGQESGSLREVEMKTYRRVPASEAGIEQSRDNEVAIVYAVGTILSGESPPPMGLGSDVVGAETFNEAMQQARTNERIQAVVLRINSPGGSAPAADAMWREIHLTAQEKPVIVSMGDVAASGGYWIATAADRIVADPLTITGSIGVYSLFLNLGGLMEDKVGITFDGITTSPYADMFSGLRNFTPAERQLLEASTDSTYQRFLRKVAHSRNKTVDDVHAIAQGRVWMGRDALEQGLVDTLGGLDTALALAAEQAGLQAGEYRLRILPQPKTFLETFSEALNARMRYAWQAFTTSPLEQALLEQAQRLQALIQDHGTIQARLPYTLRIE